MKHLIREWRTITEKLRGRRLYLFLDFDGTLAPIEKYPENVSLGRSMRGILQKLAAEKTVVVSIVSGRQLREIKKLVGVKGIIYIGNHGFETEGPNAGYAVPVAMETKKIMGTLTRKLKAALRPFDGVIVEDKRFTVSVHYRMAGKDRMDRIERIFKDITRPFRAGREIRVTTGKKVWEVRPPVKWDKGKIVLSLLRQKESGTKEKMIPFYIGDDTTDEDAFLALKDKGYTVKISGSGREKSQAKYYLKNVGEVEKILKDLCDLIKEKG
ncbi:MAG: trehalose-phosphatase [Candidatus Omnitrophota bacterium]|nr:trehalose-phosphatase [Candidatus Omnitrophota bacterium]